MTDPNRRAPEVVTLLSVDVMRKMLTKTPTNDSVLDLSTTNNFRLEPEKDINPGERKYLSPLNGLRHALVCQGKEYFTRNVKKINVSGNDLRAVGSSGGGLFELRIFRRSVESIQAENCRLERLSWQPTKDTFLSLLELNLSRNSLKDLPSLLDTCPKLLILNLAHNSVGNLQWLEYIPASLQVLDLSDNRIDYRDEESLKKDAEKGLSQFSNLLTLKFEQNPITQHKVLRNVYRARLLSSITDCKLKYLDGPVTPDMLERAKNSQLKQIEQATPKIPLVEGKRTVLIGGGGGVIPANPPQRQNGNSPTFSDLTDVLDKYFYGTSDPEMSSLIEIAKQIADSQESTVLDSSLFLPSERNANLLIREFLQKMRALSERRPEMLRPILRTLSLLAKVTDHGLGKDCLDQLKDFMGANEETRELVILNMNDIITFPTKESSNPRVIIQFLRESFCDMADQAECPVLLLKALPFLKENHKPNGPKDDRKVVSRALAILSRDDSPQGGRYLIASEEEMSKQLVEDRKDNDFEEYVLETLKNLCDKSVYYGKQGRLLYADYLSRERFHKDLVTDLDVKINQNDPNKENIIALEFDCLTALLETSRNAFADLCGIKHPPLFHFYAKYFVPKVPQIVIETAVYHGVNAVLRANYWGLQEKDLRSKKEVFEDLQSMVFQNKTETLLEYLKADSVKYGEVWKLSTTPPNTSSPPQFKELRDRKIHLLFISIINLLAAFNVAKDERRDAGASKIASTIAEGLNRTGRESRLFDCLQIESDLVKLAAVDCLDTVETKQLEPDEIGYMVKMLDDVVNVSAGKMEIVLAKAIGILTKLSSEKEKEINFQKQHGLQAINATIKILEMNVNRDTRRMQSETTEKAILTSACVKFLQESSKHEISREILMKETIATKVDRILRVEDDFAEKPKGKHDYVDHNPVLIEISAAGLRVNHLMKVFMDVSPTGPVAPRVLRRIANVLMGLSEQDTLDFTMEQQQQQQHQRKRQVREDDLNDPSLDRKFVRSEAQKEKGMLECWSMSFESEKELSEDGRRKRDERHVTFKDSLCLNQLLKRLHDAMQTLQTDFLKYPMDAKSSFAKQSIEESGTLGAGNDSLPRLLELYLMSEKERSDAQNQVEIGGGLRNVVIDLSDVEKQEALRDLGAQESELDEYKGIDETLSAAIRVIFAALKFGKIETMQEAQNVLRQASKFNLLAAIFFGSREHPNFFRSQLGAKFFLVAQAVLEIPPIRRYEVEKEVRPLHSIIFNCAERAMNMLRQRLLEHSDLAKGDEHLIYACMSCCSAAALQMEYLFEEKDDENFEGPPKLFETIVPPSLIASALKLLLHDMKQTNATKPREWNYFGELPEDFARESIINFLSYCVRHSSTHRYAILEYLIRSNITDQYPVRRILIQELMKKTHKNGYPQRLILGERAVKKEVSESSQQRKDQVRANMNLPSTTQVSHQTGTTQNSSANWNWFAWCAGGGRKDETSTSKSTESSSTPAPSNGLREEQKEEEEEEENDEEEKLENEADHDPLWSDYYLPIPDQSKQHLTGWQADRVGARARVVSHCFVRWYERDETNLMETPSFTHVLVLNSESYSLYFIENISLEEYPSQWKLIWSRPYRAVLRIAVGSSRIHILHKVDSDPNSLPVVNTAVTPSRFSARDLAYSFYRLSRAWYRTISILRDRLSTNKQISYVEKLNLILDEDPATRGTRTESQSSWYLCDMVQHAKREDSKNGWILYIAVFQNDRIHLIEDTYWRKWTFDNPKGKDKMKFDITTIKKLEYRDFQLPKDGTSPALILSFGASLASSDCALVFTDDLTRNVWRRCISERLVKNQIQNFW